jgi:hypothetical protein
VLNFLFVLIRVRFGVFLYAFRVILDVSRDNRIERKVSGFNAKSDIDICEFSILQK